MVYMGLVHPNLAVNPSKPHSWMKISGFTGAPEAQDQYLGPIPPEKPLGPMTMSRSSRRMDKSSKDLDFRLADRFQSKAVDFFTPAEAQECLIWIQLGGGSATGPSCPVTCKLCLRRFPCNLLYSEE